MWKRIILLLLYIMILVVTVSSAWILNPKRNVGPFVILDYEDSGKEESGKLTVSSKEVEMQIDFQINGKWVYFGSSNDSSFDTRPDLSNILPNTVVPFRIRFYNSSQYPVTMSLIISGIECHSVLVEKKVVYVAAVGSSEYNQYADVVSVPNYIYKSLSTATLISSKTDGKGEQVSTYDLTLYDSLQIPPTEDGKYVMLEGYFYFDAEAMDNQCASKWFNITSFRAVQK